MGEGESALGPTAQSARVHERGSDGTHTRLLGYARTRVRTLGPTAEIYCGGVRLRPGGEKRCVLREASAMLPLVVRSWDG